jgi:hypothetical protein
MREVSDDYDPTPRPARASCLSGNLPFEHTTDCATDGCPGSQYRATVASLGHPGWHGGRESTTVHRGDRVAFSQVKRAERIASEGTRQHVQYAGDSGAA